MKLYRSDLEKSFSNQLFEISTEYYELDNSKFVDKTISCKVSSESTANGYHVYGNIDADLLESCDRCLCSFNSTKNIELNIILSNNEKLINDNNIDVIQFLDSEDFVDISSVIHDLILLEIPIKKLCSNNCKGLCSNCGINLNKFKCKCKFAENDNRWDELKKIKI